MMETMQYDTRSSRNTALLPDDQYDDQPSPDPNSYTPGDASPAGRASLSSDPRARGSGEHPQVYPRETHYYTPDHHNDVGDDDDDGFYGPPARNQVDTPPPAPPPTSYQAPQSHYQIQQQQQQQYRRVSQQQQRAAPDYPQDSLRRQSAGSPPSPPPVAASLFDHSHLRPGNSAQLLSAEKTLEMYRQNAKKTNDPEMQFQFAVLMLDAIRGPAPPPSPNATQYDIEKANEQRENQVKDAIRMLQRLADRGHHEAQYFLADCYANGIGTNRGRQDFDKAYPLFVQAAKHRHADAAYRAGICCENGWGCRRDSGKAIQFYRTAGSLQHPGAMYRLGIAELNGELGLPKRPKEGVKWLKRSSEHATAEFPHALHELALLHEQGVNNVLFIDTDYSAELLAQAAELGYAPSAYRLGQCYEYGKMGCPMDPALSIHYYVSSSHLSVSNIPLTEVWLCVTEHCRTAGSPGRVLRSNSVVPRWFTRRAPTIRHGSVLVGQEGC